MLNDRVGPTPVVLAVDLQSRSTGTTWHPQRGIALSGPLKGESMKPLAYPPVFEYAWRDFYPATTWYPAP